MKEYEITIKLIYRCGQGKTQQLTWSPIRQNAVADDLAAVRQNAETDWFFTIELLRFDERLPSQLLHFDESATKRVAAFFRDHIDRTWDLRSRADPGFHKGGCEFVIQLTRWVWGAEPPKKSSLQAKIF